MKRLLCAVLLCLLVVGLCGCGKQGVVEELSTVPSTSQPMAVPQKISEHPWGVTIEQIDLDDPENQKYIDWAKGHQYERSFNRPDYFDVEVYVKQADEEPDPWIRVWENKKKNMLRERHRPWNDAKELVIRYVYSDEYSGHKELLVRDKATGETECIDKGGFYDANGVVFDPVVVLDDTRFLYSRYYWDSGDPDMYYIYDLEIGERICVAGSGLCDLGNGPHLWSDSGMGIEGGVLYLIDMRELEAGKKEAKKELVRWGSDYYAVEIYHLSSDRRFVYLDFSLDSEHTGYRTRHRGVYDIETGGQVALFEIPDSRAGYALISDDLEYGYYSAGNMDDPTVHSFYIIHYARAGEKN